MVTSSAQTNLPEETAPQESHTPYLPSRRRTFLTCLVLAALAFALCLPSLGDWATLAPDSIEYLTAARSLVETGAFPLHQLMRPPGFPTLIAPFLVSSEMPFLGIRVLLMTGWAAGAILAYLLYRRELGHAAATMIGILVALNTVLFLQTTIILTEPVFLALSLGSLLAALRWRRDTPIEWTEMVLIGWLTAAAIMVRSIGIVLVPVLVWVLLRRRCDAAKKRFLHVAVFIVCAISPSVGWQFRQHNLPESYTYGRMWLAARSAEETQATGAALQWERLTKFGPMRLASLRDAVIPQRIGGWHLSEPPYNLLSTWIVGGLFVLVAGIRFAVRRSPIDAFFLLTLLVVALWPWDEGVRLVSALIPMLYGYVLWVGVRLYRLRDCFWLRSAILACLVGLLGTHVWEMGVAQTRVASQEAKAKNRVEALYILADWQIANTPTKPKIVAILSNDRDTKPMMAGSAYLSRRTIEYIELDEEQAMSLSLVGRSDSYVFLDDTLYGIVPEQTSHVEIDAAGPFIILAPASRVRVIGEDSGIFGIPLRGEKGSDRTDSQINRSP